jgi:hypothetical protein
VLKGEIKIVSNARKEERQIRQAIQEVEGQGPYKPTRRYREREIAPIQLQTDQLAQHYVTVNHTEFAGNDTNRGS